MKRSFRSWLISWEGPHFTVKARKWMKADNGVRSIFYTERRTRRDVDLTYLVSGLSGGQDKEFKVVAESVGSCREEAGTKPRAQP